MLDRTDSIDQAHAYRLHRTSRLLRRHLEATLAPLGISGAQYGVLWRLHERDGRVQGELVDPVLDDRPNITRLVDGLVRRGLVERRRDDEDARRRRVHLTTAGRSFMKELMPTVLRLRTELFGGLDEDDLAAFERVLDHVEAQLT
jgi:MarR family transcriptional regulator, transcriptional regulator for hemolysin